MQPDPTPSPEVQDLPIEARDGFPLAATVHGSPQLRRLAVISSATAVPRGFYRAFASGLVERGFRVVTYDYRGIGGSRPPSLRAFEASARDWALLDQAGVVDWAKAQGPERLVLVGHSFGGQVAGMLDDPDAIDGMVTLSSQSGHWRLQGGFEKVAVLFHVHVTLPGLANTFGYVPWSWLGSAQDLPRGVALEWSRWCRDPRYLLGDDTLPLERYGQFTAPVLAYSFEDDTWGTARSVDAMMQAYPVLERRHVVARDVGVPKIGHFGFFRRASRPLWDDAIGWLEQC